MGADISKLKQASAAQLAASGGVHSLSLLLVLQWLLIVLCWFSFRLCKYLFDFMRACNGCRSSCCAVCLSVCHRQQHYHMIQLVRLGKPLGFSKRIWKSKGQRLVGRAMGTTSFQRSMSNMVAFGSVGHKTVWLAVDWVNWSAHGKSKWAGLTYIG